MGRMIPAVLVLLAAVPSATAGCPNPYYVALPTNTCVNDGEQASQGAGEVQLSATKEACCNTLPRKERRECLATEVPSEVYPDLERGRCSSGTVRPAALHPTCVVTDSGAIKSIAPLFLRKTLRVSHLGSCCRGVYGGIDEVAVERCVARAGTWYHVEGMGCVRDDPLADDPVVYSTAHTVGSPFACPSKYFPRAPVVMCDTFTCPAPSTPKPHGVHCGSLEGDCTMELCCVDPPPPVVTCSVHTCNAAVDYTDKGGKDGVVCATTGCTDSRCCDYTGSLPLLTPPGTLRYPADFPAGVWDIPNRVDQRWRVDCDSGNVEIDIVSLQTEKNFDYVILYTLLPDGSRSQKLRAAGSYDGIWKSWYLVPKYAPITLGSRSVVVFDTDGSVASKGFALEYKCTCP